MTRELFLFSLHRSVFRYPVHISVSSLNHQHNHAIVCLLNGQAV